MPRGNYQRVPAPDEQISVGVCDTCRFGYRVNVNSLIKAHAHDAAACPGSHGLPARVVTMPAREYKAGMEVGS